MRTDREWSPGPGVKVSATIRTDEGGGGWVVYAVMSGGKCCPACGICSSRRHGWCVRHLQDLPAQGAAVKLALRVARSRCLNPDCAQQTSAIACRRSWPPMAAGRVVLSIWPGCLPIQPEAGQPDV